MRQRHPIEDIYKVISKEDLDFIVQRVNVPSKEEYFHSICRCVDEMYFVAGLNKVINRFVCEIKEYPDLFPRSFAHLLIGHLFMRYGQLKDIETSGDISYDFILNNGLKVELTRLKDFEKIGEKRILKEIKKNQLLENLTLLFYIKTLNFDEVTKKIRTELRKPPFKDYIENNAFDLMISLKGDSIGMPVNMQIGGMMHLSTGETNHLGIQFRVPEEKLIDLILKKTKRDACRHSDILIIDLTDDFSMSSLEDEFLKIDEKLIPKNIKILIFTKFFWADNIIKEEIKYKILSQNDVIDNFEKDFLQKEGFYEKC